MDNQTPDPWSHAIAVQTLRDMQEKPVEMEPDAPTRAALAEALGISAIRKLRLSGRLIAADRADWRFEGQLGATVVQSCVVTLDPVTTRLDEPINRYFAADWDEPEAGSEMEMPSDDSIEALGREIDLGRIMAEALALALPAYPRSDTAQSGDIQVTEPGQTPMTDDEAKPFAGLKSLLSGKTEPDP